MKMKKVLGLGSLVAFATCATVGGVYAAWTYAGTDDIADSFYESKVTIAGTTLAGANGTYTITSNLVLEVDQRDEDHYAKLVFASNNSEEIFLKVVFTPSDNAPANIKENAVPSELYFDTTTMMEYKMDAYGNYDENGTSQAIFQLNPVSNGVLDENITWTKQADGTFVYELSKTDLESMIKLSTFTVAVEGSAETITDTFRLDTKAEHDAFQKALNGNIVVRVTDGTVN